MTDDSVYAMYDAIAAAASDDDRQLMEQCFGLKYNVHGLMSDPHIRTIYRPVSHTLRDWMHMTVSGGVANIQVAQVLNQLCKRGISLDMVGDFIETFTLPHRLGKTSKTWVSRKRLGDKKRESLHSFAGIMLSVLPILTCFMEDVIGDADPLSDHKVCLQLLNQILGILSFGPEDTMTHIVLLRTLLQTWSQLYVNIHTGDLVKPKFHHFAIHVVDNAVCLGRMLSCFVTERKHRATKRAALHVFRSIDNTVVKDLLNRQCEGIIKEGESLFARRYLHNPKVIVSGGTHVHYSKRAVLHCGSIRFNDIVWLASGELGKVICFWSTIDGNAVVAQLAMYSRVVENDDTKWDISDAILRLSDTDRILDAVIWGRLSETVVRVIKPPRAFV